MKTNYFFHVFLCCFIGPFLSYSQEDESLQQQLELLMEQNQSEDIDLTLLIDQLDAYKQHPLDLNTATYATLLQFPLINEFQLKSLIKHREENGKLLSVYELQSVKYWDTTSIERILPYVTVDDKLNNLPISLSNLVSDGQLEFIARTKAIIEKKVGFENVSDSIKRASNSYYWGDPLNYFTRLNYSFYNRIQLGATFEKDAGEPFFSSNPKSNIDFTSIHFLYRGGKYVKALSIGDYHVQIGQGLHCWTSSVFGKTSDAIAIKKSASVLRAHTSSAEYRFMRGVGIDLEWKRFQLAVFSSFKNSDGRIEGDSINHQITSLLSTGLHRTNSEISTKGSVNEK
ncbi:MAG: helix-hairpin-helix domain-containing protein, partial [Crocinitomicaceae bacterium]|nr:helix-hairpin-helix domain-containing protein [Crocinitomicaceae bacterium]